MQVLSSWKEISIYMGRSVRTLQRWEEHFGLPVRRPGGLDRGSVYALQEDIDRWLSKRGRGSASFRPELRERCEATAARVQKNAAIVSAHAERLLRNAEITCRVLQQATARRRKDQPTS